MNVDEYMGIVTICEDFCMDINTTRQHLMSRWNDSASASQELVFYA